MRSASWAFWASFSLPADATFRIFPRNGKTAWVRRSRACLDEPPALSPSTMKISEPSEADEVQSASLPGRRSLRTAVLRLSLEFGFPHENREHAAGAGHDIVAGDRSSAFFLSDTGGVVLQPTQQCRPQTGFVCPAIGCWDCVAVRVEETVRIGSPGYGPFDRAVAAGLAGGAGKDVGMNERRAHEIGCKVIFQPFGEMERGLLGNVLDAFEQCLVAVPANFDAAIEVGFRPRHLEDAFRLECGLGTKNIGVRLEAHARAAPIGCTTGFF